MAHISAEVWPAFLEQPEVALELIRAAAVVDVEVVASSDTVAVTARPIGSRSDAAWRIVSTLAGLWLAEVVPARVGCAVSLDRATWETSGATMCGVGDGYDRAEWMRRVAIRIG